MPKSVQPGAKKAIQDICTAEDCDHVEAAIKAFAQPYGAKFAKAVKKITDDQEELLVFFDFPAEHWIHLRTTIPIESTFSTVRLRTKVTRGAGSRTAALAMVFKLVEPARAGWRAVNAPHLVTSSEQAPASSAASSSSVPTMSQEMALRSRSLLPSLDPTGSSLVGSGWGAVERDGRIGGVLPNQVDYLLEEFNLIV